MRCSSKARARVASGRLPIIVFGGSDAAQGYVHNENADASVQRCQTDAEWAYRMFCHQGESNDAAWLIRDEIGPLGPFWGTSVLRTSWLLDLGAALSADGIPVTFLAYPVGGSTFDGYSPSLNPAAYAQRLAWLRAGLAKMPGHLDPILLTDQGMAGQGTYPWVDAMAELMTALRADLGHPNMKVCQVRAPVTANMASLITAQNAYAEVDENYHLAWYDGTTFVDDDTLEPGEITGVHFDAVSGRKLAIGPDDAVTQSVLTVIRELIE